MTCRSSYPEIRPEQASPAPRTLRSRVRTCGQYYRVRRHRPLFLLWQADTSDFTGVDHHAGLLRHSDRARGSRDRTSAWPVEHDAARQPEHQPDVDALARRAAIHRTLPRHGRPLFVREVLAAHVAVETRGAPERLLRSHRTLFASCVLVPWRFRVDNDSSQAAQWVRLWHQAYQIRRAA